MDLVAVFIGDLTGKIVRIRRIFKRRKDQCIGFGGFAVQFKNRPAIGQIPLIRSNIFRMIDFHMEGSAIGIIDFHVFRLFGDDDIAFLCVEYKASSRISQQHHGSQQ